MTEDAFGVVVVVVPVDALEVWLASSWVNLASADCRESSAEETDSLSDVVSRVANVSPAVTCAPGTAVTVATCPATWKLGEASFTGSIVPTTTRLLATEASTAFPMR